MLNTYRLYMKLNKVIMTFHINIYFNINANINT